METWLLDHVDFFTLNRIKNSWKSPDVDVLFGGMQLFALLPCALLAESGQSHLYLPLGRTANGDPCSTFHCVNV